MSLVVVGAQDKKGNEGNVSVVNDLLAIYSQLQSDRAPHEPVLDQVRDLFMPFRGDMTTRGYGGRKIGAIFDSPDPVAGDPTAPAFSLQHIDRSSHHRPLSVCTIVT